MRSDLDILKRATELLCTALCFVDSESLGLPTPCSAWHVADLLDHISGGNRFTVQILHGSSAAEALASARASFADGHLAIDAARESAEAQLVAFAGDDVLDRRYDHVVGRLTGEQILRLRIHDLSIHSWDLLQAVNPTKGLDPVYVRWAIDELANPDSLTARHVATGFTNPSKPYELLLAFGRRRRSQMARLHRDA